MSPYEDLKLFSLLYSVSKKSQLHVLNFCFYKYCIQIIFGNRITYFLAYIYLRVLPPSQLISRGCKFVRAPLYVTSHFKGICWKYKAIVCLETFSDDYKRMVTWNVSCDQNIPTPPPPPPLILFIFIIYVMSRVTLS